MLPRLPCSASMFGHASATYSPEAPMLDEQTQGKTADDWKAFLEASPMHLGLGIRLSEVRNLNPAAGTFYAKFLLHILFRDPDLPEVQSTNLTQDEVPNLPIISAEMFYNATDDLHINYWDSHPTLHATGKGYVKAYYWVYGTFTERFDLHNFPYDLQELKVCMRNVRPTHDHQGWYAFWPLPTKGIGEGSSLWTSFTGDLLTKGMGEGSSVWTSFTGNLLDEFTLFEPPISYQSSMSSMGVPHHELTGRDSKHFAVFAIIVQRKPWFFELNVIIVLFVLTSMSFMTARIAADDIADMSSITLTLILTAVAYKFIIADNMPKCSYSTALDKYVLGCFGMMTLVVFENTFAQELRPYMFYVLAVLWTAFNVAALVGRCVLRTAASKAVAAVKLRRFEETSRVDARFIGRKLT